MTTHEQQLKWASRSKRARHAGASSIALLVVTSCGPAKNGSGPAGQAGNSVVGTGGSISSAGGGAAASAGTASGSDSLGGRAAPSGGASLTAGGSPAQGGAVLANGGAPAAPGGAGGTEAGAPRAGNGSQTQDSGGASAVVGGSSPGLGGAPVAPDSHALDHCVYGYEPDPRDAAVTSAPDEWKASSGEVDLVLPAKVLEWLHERVWEQSHDAWHNVRRCRNAAIPGMGMSSICSHADLIPEHQECADAEDGYEFLVMHRHMLQGLKQSFPQHAELFAAFPHFPYAAEDVPAQWRSRFGTGWSAQIKSVADKLEAIEQHLDEFPSEGDLGRYIQCGGMSNGASSIHGALHFKWVVNESPYSLGKQPVNIDNYMFWKLHGWIDNVWERYRTAKGLSPDDPKLKQSLADQCREMQRLGLVFDPAIADLPDAPLPVEHGVFHETVRPILERVCAGCHGEKSPEANLSLGGHISSAEVVKQLVGVTSAHGGQFKRVVAGKPDESWLYLKATGTAMNVGCQGASCNAQVMPPTGQVTLTSAELDAIRGWIAAGAPAPTE